MSHGEAPSIEYLREEMRRFTDELARAEFELERLRAQHSQAKIESTVAREESSKLKAEVTRLISENDQQHEKYLAEHKKVQRLELALHDNAHVAQAREELRAERSRFRATLAELLGQYEHLRTIHPIRALLAAKENETEIAERTLARIPHKHPDRAAMEGIVMMHHEEREQLRSVAEETEMMFAQRQAELQAAAAAEPETPEPPRRSSRVPTPPKFNPPQRPKL